MDCVANLSARTLLPGNLRLNIDECAAIATRLGQPNGDLTIPLPAIRGLLYAPTDASQMTDDESLQAFVCPDAPTLYPYEGQQYSYDPRHMLCFRCLLEILGQRFYRWWVAERKSPRVNSKSIESIEYSEYYLTGSYPLQLPIWRTVGGDGNVELSECLLIR